MINHVGLGQPLDNSLGWVVQDNISQFLCTFCQVQLLVDQSIYDGPNVLFRAVDFDSLLIHHFDRPFGAGVYGKWKKDATQLLNT